MGKLIERCAGIDIGKRFLVCCVMTGAAHEEPRSETRRFDTTVPGLKRLRNWLNEERVTDVVMESTGSYWIPVFNLLEGHVTVVLANPEEVKNRKGHKTDTFTVWRITAKKRMVAKLKAIKVELRRRMHARPSEVGAWLRKVVNGDYQYHAVPGNIRQLSTFRQRINRLWYQVLARRSQRARKRWEALTPLFERWIPRPKVLHPYPQARFYATHPS